MTIMMTRTITRILICQIKKDNENNDENVLYTDENLYIHTIELDVEQKRQ